MTALHAPAVLCDTRPARGKHRTRPDVAAAASSVLAWSRRARGSFALVGMTVGALLAPALLP